MRVESIQVGRTRARGEEGAADPLDRPWTSAIWKSPVEGAVWVDVHGVTGDEVADRVRHGGPDRAVLMYPADHYLRWHLEWNRKDVTPGGFGENLTVSGLDEYRVCLGDLFEAGGVHMEISAPRGPCHTLVRRHRVPDLVQVIQRNHRHGWYMRVLQPGWLSAGAPLRLLDRPFPQWTVARAGDVKWGRGSAEEERLLSACPALIDEWRNALKRPVSVGF